MTDIAAKPSDAQPAATDSQGMGFLVTRQHKLVTVYLPLAIFIFVLLLGLGYVWRKGLLKWA